MRESSLILPQIPLFYIFHDDIRPIDCRINQEFRSSISINIRHSLGRLSIFILVFLFIYFHFIGVRLIHQFGFKIVETCLVFSRILKSRFEKDFSFVGGVCLCVNFDWI